MFDSSSTKPLSSKLSLMAGIATALIVLLLACGHLWSISKADLLSTGRQEESIRRDLALAIARIGQEQETATIWDDAATAMSRRDLAWVEKHLGQRLIEIFGYDRILVLAADDNLIYSGGNSSTAGFDPHSTAISGIVENLRQQVGGLKGAAAGHIVVSEVISTVDGQVFVVSAKPIVARSSVNSPTRSSVPVHLVITAVDQEFVDSITGRFRDGDARFSTEPSIPYGWMSIPITNSADRTLGYLSWEPYRPGHQLLNETGPAFLLGTALIFMIVLLLMRGFRKASTDLETSKSHAQHLALHDPLTALPNRSLFENRLTHALASSQRSRGHVALLVIDIDQFKGINDTLGHPAGDELIRQIAMRLSHCVRTVDTVARLGGDEFAIIVPDVASARDIETLCERILMAMEEPFDLMGNSAFSGVSIGVAIANEHTADASDLLRKADIALYESKGADRGTYRLFTGDMDDLTRRRRMIETDLRVALVAQDQLHLQYQPLFSPQGNILGAEALVRWDHPVHGALSPEHFVKIAEERGIILQLGNWVIEEACRYAASSAIPWVAVNVSPIQVRKASFFSDVIAILERTGLSPDRLQIEITEGVLLESSTTVTQTIRQLRDCGVRLSLDDFGTGYSSLMYLRKYALDKLKIDRSFVAQLSDVQSSDVIIRAIVSIAKSMGMQVTAEGVETVEQRDHLATIGCHELQGFLLARPMTGDDLNIAIQQAAMPAALSA